MTRFLPILLHLSCALLQGRAFVLRPSGVPHGAHAAVAAPTLATSTTAFSSAPAQGAVSNSNQAEYGKSMEMPGTYVKCGKCQTAYAIREEDLGGGKGRRLECSVCGHTWFQSKERIMSLRDGYELVELPDMDKDRIAQNLKEGKPATSLGDLKLYVGNIPFGSTPADVAELFGSVGTVGDVSIATDPQGKPRGFGFVTMRTKEDGLKAISELNGASFNGRDLAVRHSTN